MKILLSYYWSLIIVVDLHRYVFVKCGKKSICGKFDKESGGFAALSIIVQLNHWPHVNKTMIYRIIVGV